MDIEKSITEMFLEVYNFPVNHNRVKKHYPSECLSEICEALASIEELAENRHIQTELKVKRGLCTVEFVYFENVSDSYPFERRVREKFDKGLLV